MINLGIADIASASSNISCSISTELEINSYITPFKNKKNDEINRRYKWHCLANSDMPFLSSWIKSRKALKLISSDYGEKLTHDIISSWNNISFLSVIATETERDIPIGFFTLSTQEANNLPPSAIELCHLMVKPREDYFLVGSYLCTVAKAISKLLGFSMLIGRVVPVNTFGIRLALSQGFRQVNSSETWTTPEFYWFISIFKKTKLIIKERRWNPQNIKPI